MPGNKRAPLLLPNIISAIADMYDKDGTRVREIISHVRNTDQRPFPQKNLIRDVRKALRHGISTGLLKFSSGKYRLAVPLKMGHRHVRKRHRRIHSPHEHHKGNRNQHKRKPKAAKATYFNDTKHEINGSKSIKSIKEKASRVLALRSKSKMKQSKLLIPHDEPSLGNLPEATEKSKSCVRSRSHSPMRRSKSRKLDDINEDLQIPPIGETNSVEELDALATLPDRLTEHYHLSPHNDKADKDDYSYLN